MSRSYLLYSPRRKTPSGPPPSLSWFIPFRISFSTYQYPSYLPLFTVPAAAAQVSVHQNGGKNADTGLYVVAGAVTADITFDFDNIRSVALGTNMCIFHIDSSHTRIS